MDPQKKIWGGDPGHKYKLRNNKPQNQISFLPFVFADPCSLETKQNYPGTLFRFPLRNERSDLSDKLYTTAKLKLILKALKDDASILLLFLRYIEKVEVFTINTSNFVTKLFSIETDKATEGARKSLKDAFFKQVKLFHSVPGTSLPFLQYEVTISVHDIEVGKHTNHHWIIANWVGSENKEIRDASKTMCSLPWLGLATSLTSQCPSRLSCFLPMPDSEEVNPPLPVYVHGTFGLTKDRRHLKWKTSDMQNDDGALWNDLLLSKMLPSCYAKFINALKDKCDHNIFYSFWPNVHFVNQTNWRVVLRPLLSLLLQDQLFWSQNGSWVKLQPSVYVVPQMNSGQFPQVIINALIKCGKVVIVLADRVWEAVKYICTHSNYPFTTITPSLVRAVLKTNSASYTSATRANKFKLLDYCIKDASYNDLPGLILLPIFTNIFVAFGSDCSRNKLYVCDKAFLHTRLLANNEAVLVNIEADDSNLHQKLIEIASSNCTQLQRLTTEAFAMILRQLFPFQNGFCCYGAAGGFYNENWLKTFWNWVSAHQLSHFVNICLMPVCNEKNLNGFKVIALQNKKSSKLIKFSRNTSFYPELVPAAGKLGCYLTCAEEFEYLYHAELKNYVNDLTPASLLSIASQANYKNFVFSQNEARALRHFIFQCTVSLSMVQQSVALNLHIFPTMQNNKLCSVQAAKYTVAGRSAAMIMLEPEKLSKYRFCIPQSPLILTSDRASIGNLLATLPGSCWYPSKLQIIIHVILQALQNDQFTRENTLKVTAILLENCEYNLLINESEGNKLINTLKSLKFIPTSQRTDLHYASKVYDPEDQIIKDLFSGEKIFPIAPFTVNHFAVLRQLGMKNSKDLDPSDVIDVTHLICNQGDTQARIKRANHLLEFLSSTKGNFLLNSYYNRKPLDQTLCSISWLPVMVTPPKGYPNCLGWKGATGSQFVSAQHIHASSSQENHKQLPYLIGSQIKILEHERFLSAKLLASFNISQSVPLDAMIQQLLNLIAQRKDVEPKKFNRCIKLLYDHLQSAALNNPSSQCWNGLSQSEVVQIDNSKYVKPYLVACSYDDNSMTVGKLEPYLYILPNHVQQYRSFFCHIGVKKCITKSDVFLVLEKIASNPHKSDWILVNKILKWLCFSYNGKELQQLHDKIYLPVNSDSKDQLVLKSANKVAFLDEDLEWLRNEKEALSRVIDDYYLVHSSVPYEITSSLQLKPLSTMIANAEEFCFEQAGQSEPLTTRLNRILREYKDTSVIQELLQNADDARATEVAVYYDTREHDSSNLLFRGMANSYGPALLFYNNAEFTEEDFENIRKIAGETKINKPLKIGKFGVGFCSVYHITDVPSFVSGENFVVFDPMLQYLGKEIRSEFYPGIKVNFQKHFLLNKSNQLLPYTGVCNFDSKKRFQGTLFRFPLRFKRSKISEDIYTERKVQSMFDTIKGNSSKLLMFLNSIKKMSFYRSHGNNFVKEFEVISYKQVMSNNIDLITCKVSSELGKEKYEKQKWLIATSSQLLKTDHQEQKHGIASVSVKIKIDEQLENFCIDSTEGECFCYLPLNIKTGLPVHVSSNFAVTTNRRGIWKADNTSTVTKESNWNKILMESVVFQAYVALLVHLQRMQQNRSLLTYTYHCLWPIYLMEINPWEYLINKFYSSILSSQQALLYSEISNSWKYLHECKFMSDKILSIGFNTNLHSSLHQVVNILNLPVVDLPSKFWNKFENSQKFQAQIITEEQFVHCFYQDETLAKIAADAKISIVTASLIVYTNGKHYSVMPRLMQATRCIPCSPDGKSFKKPHEIIDPGSKISKLFLSDDGLFPDENFLKQNNLLTQSLSKLGLMKSLSWTLIIDRASCVQEWYNENQKEALNRLRLVILFDCIKENCNSNLPDRSIEQQLQKVSFLPVMQKPQHYPIKWKGDSFANFLPGPEITKVSDKENSVNAVYACGSQAAILNTKLMPQHSHALDKVFKLLGINQEIKIVHVINQFTELLQWYETCKSDKISTETMDCVNAITITVYQFLDKRLNAKKGDVDHDLLKHLSSYKGKACIWNGKCFLQATHVSFTWTTDGPYLYKLPENLRQYITLMQHLGIEDKFSYKILVNTLTEMKMNFKNDSLSSDCQTVVRLICPKLDCTVDCDAEVFLPDKNFVLRSVKELKYNDVRWCVPDTEYMHCHECVERKIAINLGIKPVKSIFLKDLDIDCSLTNENFGQEEKLTQRLHSILRDYPRDITFLKELLQTADDAGAEKLFVILDKRYHNNEKVISEEWKQLQGPALLFWNSSTFTEDDLIDIQKIGLGIKRDDADKIGRYGFNVVYHYTDCPSFIVNDRLCILDPHYRYIAGKRTKAGRMFKDLKALWKRFPDMKSSYLQQDLDEFPVEIKKGALFRLPLRLTREDAEQSEIVSDDSFFELQSLEKDFKKWISLMQEALLFVHHVCDLRFFVINDTKKHLGVLHWQDPNLVNLCNHVESTKGKKNVIFDESGTKLTVYNLRLADKKMDKEEKWIIQLGEGNAANPSFDWKAIKPPNVKIRPQHGIAACIHTNFMAKSFCFLPLPGYTHLPVHVHGQFVLHSDRSDSIADTQSNPDTNKNWNEFLIEAIGMSYAHFLTHCIKQNTPVCTEEDAMKSLGTYYKLFPVIKETSTEPWKTLAKEVYKALAKLNSPILASLIEDGSDTLNLQDHHQNQLYTIEWYNLLLPNAPNEGYFHSFHSYKTTLCKVFKDIGMNLVSTPQFICEQFKEVGINLPVISEESILAYYIKFHDEIYHHHKLPCHVSKTKFKNVKNFISFIIIIYLPIVKCNFKQDNIETEDDDLTEQDNDIIVATSDTNDINLNLQNIGFLITADEHIHCLSDGKEIISSSNWSLFQKSQDTFLHKTLNKKNHDLNPFLFQGNDSGEGYNLVYSIFATNLPPSWHGVDQAPLEDIDISWVKNLLACIAEDPVFSCYQEQLLQDFTLIPADNKVLFSCKSNLLPMKAEKFDHGMYRIEIIMRKLKMPFVDNNVLESTLSNTKIHLPDITVETDVLKSIYLVTKDCSDNLMALSKEELTELFSLVSYYLDSQHRNDSVYYIKQLPIFKTIYGQLVSLSSASKVWIWNNDVCETGLGEWINHISKSVIFLDPSAPWTALLDQAEHLNIKKISLYEVYCNYIFLHFGTMNSAMRIEHIKFVSKCVFDDCRHESERKHVSSDSTNHIQAIEFIKKFKALPCIGDSAPLRCISSFYDHTQDIFKVFCDSQCFLPKELQDDDIQESLKFFGLKTAPTTDEFLDYCRHVSNYSEVSCIKQASEIVLKVLFFQNKDEYQHLYDPYTLQEVSHIPIAVIENFPKLNVIKAQYFGDHTVKDESETVNLTELSGSCVATYKHCVWTCKPLVRLPTKYFNNTITPRLKALGVSIVPSTDDVITNLANLADTEFANFSRFHKVSHQSATISCGLPKIVIKMLECIGENIRQIKHGNREFYYKQLQQQLKDINFLPVKLKVHGYALVKPTQVLLMEPSLLTPYYPFLHPLINEAQSLYQFLSHIGVKMSLDFSHMQLFFKLAKDQCKETAVNYNMKCAVAKATVELTLLLSNAEGNNEAIHLHPLYLLNDQDILTECSRLVVFNVSGDHLVLPSKFTYLNMLRDMPVAKHWNPEELLHLLPRDVGLKSLRSILQCEMVDSVSVLSAHSCHSCVTTIENILRSNSFKTAIEKLECCCIHKPNPSEYVTEILTNFQNKLQVKYLSEVMVQPKLDINNELIPLQDTICQEFFLHYHNDKYILSLKNTSESYPTRIFRKLSIQLCSILQLEVHEDDEVPELTSFVCDILSCGSVFKVPDVIRDSLSGCDGIEQDMISTNPVLGEVIPECWHHRLDQSIFNYFLPEEWVGYENEEGKIVYAQILHCTEIDKVSEEDMEQILQQRYIITIGGGEPIEVTVLKLYKFVNELKEPLEDFGNRELDIYEASGTNHEESIYQAADKKTIRAAVKAAWSLPEELRKKVIKRLFLQYHPDKNPDNPHATANFQLLQREIERMENGISEEEFDTTQSFRSSGFENSRWGGLFNQWSRTASSHSRYRTRDRGTSMGGMSGGWNTPTPNKDLNEANRWIKQAEYDYETLSTLNVSSQQNEKTCAATCFMSHEVAEKALKAGMYAKCGMGNATLKCHSLASPAHALVQMGCSVNIADAAFLENFYTKPRFPYCYSSPIVPGEKYLSSTAREAFLAATRIYEAMKKLIDDDDE